MRRARGHPRPARREPRGPLAEAAAHAAEQAPAQGTATDRAAGRIASWRLPCRHRDGRELPRASPSPGISDRPGRQTRGSTRPDGQARAARGSAPQSSGAGGPARLTGHRDHRETRQTGTPERRRGSADLGRSSRGSYPPPGTNSRAAALRRTRTECKRRVDRVTAGSGDQCWQDRMLGSGRLSPTENGAGKRNIAGSGRGKDGGGHRASPGAHRQGRTVAGLKPRTRAQSNGGIGAPWRARFALK
jgi:hypothetical protein